MTRQRDGLVARIRQIRRDSVETPEGTGPSTSDSQDELRSLEARITHLEQLVEGLQDSVHRESTRLNARIGELDARFQPSALAKALSDDARERGL